MDVGWRPKTLENCKYSFPVRPEPVEGLGHEQYGFDQLSPNGVGT
jgi:hypothetical protein